MEKRLTEDLNVVANSNLEIQLLDGDLNIIQKLDDEPNDVGGLTSAELKAKFDESGNIIKKYINETLIPAVLTDDATEESRKQAEAARVAAEQGRVTAEEGRVSAESGRVSAEQARANAEASRVSAETARVQAETARADETAGIVARATAQANAAAGSASQAAGSEQAAQSAANTATSAASSASQSAATASGSASQAQAGAAAAAQSAASVDGINKTAQSWAVGGTGTRPGEDTNNAKYWAEQAQTAVGGDFATKTEAQGYVDTHNQSVDAHADIRSAVAGSVRYDEAQILTDEQKTQARTNIGADTVQGAVLYTPQTLSDDQKTQARGNIGAAPAGFGVGEIVSDIATIGTVAELDATEKSGLYYYYNMNEPIGNFPYGQSGMVLVLSTVAVKRQYFFPRQTDSRWWVRQKTNYADTWGELEFGKVPMDLGVEYRTTERYLGKPVYTKAVDFGALPNATTKTVTWAASGEVLAVLSVEATGSQGDPVGLGASLSGTELTATKTTLYVKSSGDYSSNTAVFRLKYTKTTD